MSVSPYYWTHHFQEAYQLGSENYRQGCRQPEKLLPPENLEFLASIGCSPREMFDYIEDWVRSEALPPYDSLLIASVRRDYFLRVQNGKPATRTVPLEDFPGKKVELDGIPWLPRLILKTKAKLRGEMPDSLMYCCGGDRRFFKKFHWHPADFLRLVWEVEGNPDAILKALRG